MPANTKTLLLQRLRRTNMPLARRVRQLHADWFERMSGVDGLLSPAQPVATTAPFSLAKQVLVRSKHCEPFLKLLSTDLQAQWRWHQQQSDRLLRSAATLPYQPSHEALTVQQFNELCSTDEAPIPPANAIQMLAERFLYLDSGQHRAANGHHKVLRTFLGRAESALNAMLPTFQALEQEILTFLSPRVFHGGSASLVQIDPQWASRCQLSLFKSMLDLPADHALLVIGNSFTQSRAPVLLSSPSFFIKHMVPESLASIEGDHHEPTALQLLGHPHTPEVDRLLNMPQKGLRSPLQALADSLSRSPQSEPTRLALTLADLDDLAQMHATAGVGTLRFRDRQLPCRLTLLAETPVYVRDDNGWSLSALGNVAARQGLSVRPSLFHETMLSLPSSTLNALKSAGRLDVSLVQQDPNTLLVSAHLPTPSVTTPAVHWPDPAAREQKLLTELYQEQLTSRHYLDKVYTYDELRHIESTAGAPTGFGPHGLRTLLSSCSARTVVLLDTHTHQHQRGTPYYVSLTLMSLRQDDIYARRIGCFIHAEGEPVPTPSQLRLLGISEQEFLAIARTTADAEAHLLKPLRNAQSGPWMISGERLDVELGRLKQGMPILHETLSKLPGVSRQLITQTQQLSGRRDQVFTLSLEKNNGKPVHFFDAAGTPNSLMTLASVTSGQWMSHDRSASLILQDGVVTVLEHASGLQGTLGTATEVYRQIQQNLRPAAAGLHSGVSTALLQHQQNKKWLADIAPQTPRQLVEPIAIGNVPMRRLDFSETQWTTLTTLWNTMQRQYRFDWSIDDNIAAFSTIFYNQGVPLNTVISGGVGGQRGKKYLRELHQSQPLLLPALLQGKSFAWLPDEPMDMATRLDPADTSLTVQIWLQANATQLLRHNPEHAMHAQMEHHIDDFLLQFEPTTQTLPSLDFRHWAASTGIDKQWWQKFYHHAHEARQGIGMYDSLTASARHRHPLDTHPLQEVIAFTRALSESPLPMSGVPLLTRKSAERWLDLQNQSLTLQDDRGAWCSVPFLQNLKLQVQAIGPSPSKETLAQLERLLPVLHLHNGLYRTVPKAGWSDPVAQQQARAGLISLLQNPLHHERFLTAERMLTNDGISAVHVRPADHVFQTWCKKVTLHAMGLADEPLPFNDTWMPDDLSKAAKHISGLLMDAQWQFQVVSKQAGQRLAHILQLASNQYVAIHALRHWRQTLAGVPIWNTDLVTQKRQYAQQCEATGLPIVPVSLAEAVQINAENTELPLLSRKALRGYEEGGNLPEEPLARQIVQQTIKLLREPPPWRVSQAGPLDGLLRDFINGAATPFDKLLDNQEYLDSVLTMESPTPDISPISQPKLLR